MQKKSGMPWLLGTLCLVILLLAACGQGPDSSINDPNQPVSSEDTPVPVEGQPDGEVVRRENAIVEEMDILIMESFPLQVSVHVKGQTIDGCTTVDKTWAEQVDENTFEVHIETVRPKDAMCTEALVPFEENVPLDVYGLLAGTYTVKINDLSKAFTFEQDNVIPE
jgi:inhibitor of cysteine peptidase